MIDPGLQDLWLRQPDRGPLRGFVFFDNRGLRKIHRNEGVAFDQPRAAATATFAYENICDMDARRDELRQPLQFLDCRSLGVDDDRRRRG